MITLRLFFLDYFAAAFDACYAIELRRDAFRLMPPLDTLLLITITPLMLIRYHAIATLHIRYCFALMMIATLLFHASSDIISSCFVI